MDKFLDFVYMVGLYPAKFIVEEFNPVTDLVNLITLKVK